MQHVWQSVYPLRHHGHHATTAPRFLQAERSSDEIKTYHSQLHLSRTLVFFKPLAAGLASGLAFGGVPVMKLGGWRDGVDGVADTLFNLLHRDDYHIPGSNSHMHGVPAAESTIYDYSSTVVL